MSKISLSKELLESYEKLKYQIQNRLVEFENVPKSKYFYELCYCIMTPQTKAESAFKVQIKLEELDFLNKDIKVNEILEEKSHYIRFHNQKSDRLYKIKSQFPEILSIIENDWANEEKRIWIRKNINGIGMKESAHFLRNIGFKNLGILDRHILKHLVLCGLYNEIPKIANDKDYLKVEEDFQKLSKITSIPMDELDLLFWSYQAGLILK